MKSKMMMHHSECTKCNKEIVRKDFYLSTVFYCESCFDYKITERICEHEFILIFFELSNGAEQLRKYCKKCRHRNPEILPQKGIDLNRHPHRKEEGYVKMISELRGAEGRELRPFISKLKEGQQRLFFKDYYEYINSEEWREKRNNIITRDNGICQICGAGANDVHHLTYAHFKEEYDFELISLCRECHHSHYHSPEVKNKILKLNVPDKI